MSMTDTAPSFFVMDCRGIKDLHQHCGGGTMETHMRELCRKFPACDWEVHGEEGRTVQLLMDLGMGFSSQSG